MKKYKLEDKTSKYKELDKNFGGIITWILKLSKQYELKIDAKKLENEVEKSMVLRNEKIVISLKLEKENRKLEEKKDKLKLCFDSINDIIDKLDELYEDMEAQESSDNILKNLSVLNTMCEETKIMCYHNEVIIPININEIIERNISNENFVMELKYYVERCYKSIELTSRKLDINGNLKEDEILYEQIKKKSKKNKILKRTKRNNEGDKDSSCIFSCS